MSVISESGIELVPLTRSISRDISPQITAPISFKFTPEADNEGLMRGDNRYETLTNFINFMPFLSLLIVKLISAALLIFFFYYISAWAGFHLVGGVPNSGYVKTVFTLAVVYVCMRVFNIYQVKICLGVSARRLHIVMLKVFSNCPLADLFQQIPINTVSDSLGWKFENIDGKGWKNLESLLDNFFNTWIILLVVLMYSSPVILTCLILSCLFISRRRRIFMRFLRGLVINGKLEFFF